mmetsp:Transcript_40662/g.62008  ORF Transcript_40662/g.62008 Transcript_40662/m.62008 type:complete len:114 (-) Transcript_40662:372-713(-)
MIVAEKPKGDYISIHLMLEALEAVASNKFSQIEMRLSEFVSILLSVSLQDQFNEDTSAEAVLFLKRKCAKVFGSIFNPRLENECSKPSRVFSSAKIECSNILVQNLFKSMEPA